MVTPVRFDLAPPSFFFDLRFHEKHLFHLEVVFISDFLFDFTLIYTEYLPQFISQNTRIEV